MYSDCKTVPDNLSNLEIPSQMYKELFNVFVDKISWCNFAGITLNLAEQKHNMRLTCLQICSIKSKNQ